MQAEKSHVLLSVEAEAYVEALEKFNVKDVGGPRWMRQHENMEKLNMQAVLSASTQEDEFIKEFLVSCGKVGVLIHDLLVTEVWKQNVFPELVDMDFKPKSNFPIYMVLYHEATVVNLLETTMFHAEVCEAAEEGVLDLTDYCYRKLTSLLARKDDEDEDPLDKPEVATQTTGSSMEELEQQEEVLEFEISVKALAILRYITDNLENLPLSVMTRVLNTHDVPVLLVELVENPPWSKRRKGKEYRYIDSKWQEIPPSDRFKLTKTEGQVWIALFNLILNLSCQQKYDMNSYRKNVILRLRSRFNEMLLDQLPVLGEMQRFLEHLSMMEPPAPKKDLVLEQVPEIRDNILKEFKGTWKALAKKQAKSFFNPTTAAMQEQAKRWADTYNFDVMSELIAEPPKCVVCGEPASKRCSRCQNEWYCRRECQVGHWSKHKPACNLLYESLQKLKENGDATATQSK